ncbi:MAG: SDR family oxidoreductase [Dehalococcoidales bacterium]|nr:SDR family oxidoreductase [Dehalococcoidales bacterium]
MASQGIFDLSGKVALITGASRGLGRAFAEGMAEFGADVACTGRDKAMLDETVKIIGKYGHRAIAIIADMTREDDIRRMMDECEAKLGKIDIYVNNAGVTSPPTKIHLIDVNDWDRVINTNLRGMFLGIKYVIPKMLKNKGGSIINITSVAGLRAEVPEVAPAHYGASKAAIINLTQVAAMEYARDNIRVNCIAPGIHLTELGHPKGVVLDDETIKKLEVRTREYCASEVPLGRPALPSELKGLAILLASEASSYITGQVLVQDGGQSARL